MAEREKGVYWREREKERDIGGREREIIEREKDFKEKGSGCKN